MGAPFLKCNLTSQYIRFCVKIFESRAKSFYKLTSIKILKRNITGLREVEILKVTYALFTIKELDGTENDTVQFVAFEATP